MRIFIISFLMTLPVMLLSLSIHESAHGLMARKCGDNTAHNMGRITLNPIKHLDPIGFLCMALIGFGWAKPVPVISRNFKNHKAGIILTSVAGPVSNLLLGFLFAVIFRFAAEPLLKQVLFAPSDQLRLIFECLYLMLFIAVNLNVTLAVFNLLPIPPLDGSKILFSVLPYKIYYKIMPYEKYISLAFALLLILGVLSPVLSWGTDLIVNLFFRILGM